MKKIHNINCTNCNKFNHLATFFKAISDETRLRIIYTIAEKECNVNNIAEILAMEQSTISHSLKVLKREGFVKARRDGKQVFYSLDDEHIFNLLQTAFTHVEHKLKDNINCIKE